MPKRQPGQVLVTVSCGHEWVKMICGNCKHHPQIYSHISHFTQFVKLPLTAASIDGLNNITLCPI